MSVFLSEKAMLVKLSISRWSSFKYDKDVSKKVALDYCADTVDAGNYNKKLLDKTALMGFTSVISEARNFNYRNTLPWHDDGARILPSANFEEYSKKMRELERQFNAAVRTFCDNYVKYVDDAKVRLGNLFIESDYPAPESLVEKFSFSVVIEPIPSAADFRVKVQEDEVEKIQKSLEARLAGAQKLAVGDLWKRMYDSVSRLVERLSNEDARLRDGLILNIKELVGLLPRLNVVEDPAIDDICIQMEEKLCQCEAEDLRNDPAARRKTLDDAKGILDAMAGYVGTGKGAAA